jgi:hypothetical protein
VLGLAEVVHQEPMKMIVLGLQKMPLAYDPDPDSVPHPDLGSGSCYFRYLLIVVNKKIIF